MGARTKARKRALDILFESDQRGLPVAETLTARQEASAAPLNPYTVTLVEGVDGHRAEIDEAITAYSAGWPLDRMPAVDRTIIRIGVFELRHVDEVPDAVALSRGGLARARAVDRRVAVVRQRRPGQDRQSTGHHRLTPTRQVSRAESPGFARRVARFGESRLAFPDSDGVPLRGPQSSSGRMTPQLISRSARALGGSS